MSTLPLITRAGYICTPRRACKRHVCEPCGQDILPGDLYYSVSRAGGGVGWLAHPDRLHPYCLEEWLEGCEHEADRERAILGRVIAAVRP